MLRGREWVCGFEEEGAEERGGDGDGDSGEGGGCAACLSVVAIREGMRNENAMSGWGSIAIELNEERVAPWNLSCRCLLSSLGPSSSEVEEEEEVDGEEEGSQTGMREVTTATG